MAFDDENDEGESNDDGRDAGGSSSDHAGSESLNDGGNGRDGEGSDASDHGSSGEASEPSGGGGARMDSGVGNVGNGDGSKSHALQNGHDDAEYDAALRACFGAAPLNVHFHVMSLYSMLDVMQRGALMASW